MPNSCAPASIRSVLVCTTVKISHGLARGTMLDEDTRRAYASRVRGYLAWLDAADVDGDPLTEPKARDGAVRDYRVHLQTVANRKPATINTVLAAIADFYVRRSLGAPDVKRLNLPQQAPRALDPRDITRWLRTVERWTNPRDPVLADPVLRQAAPGRSPRPERRRHPAGRPQGHHHRARR